MKMSGIGLRLHPRLGEKYKRVVSNNVCLGLKLSRSKVYVHPSLDVKQLLWRNVSVSRCKIRNAFVSWLHKVQLQGGISHLYTVSCIYNLFFNFVFKLLWQTSSLSGNLSQKNPFIPHL